MEQSFLYLKGIISDKLYYHKLDIRVSPTEDIILDSWPGSFIRNNFLFAASQIKTKKGTTLFEVIATIPINNTNCLFQELSGGFPKCFSIYFPENVYAERYQKLQKDEIFSFSICIFGKMSEYYIDFIEAIKLMCKRGMGKPISPLQLIDICESHPHNRPSLLTSGTEGTIKALKHPISIMN